MRNVIINGIMEMINRSKSEKCCEISRLKRKKESKRVKEWLLGSHATVRKMIAIEKHDERDKVRHRWIIKYEV